MPIPTSGALALRKPLSSEAPDGPGSISNLADDIDDRLGRTAASLGGLAAGTRYGQRAIVGALEARWNGIAWRPWDSDLADWPAGRLAPVNLSFGTVVAKWRYSAGRVHAYLHGNLGGASNGGGGVAALQMPVTMAAFGDQIPKGNAFVNPAGGGAIRPLGIAAQSADLLQFSTIGGTNPAAAYYVNAGNMGGNGSDFYVSFDYEPA